MPTKPEITKKQCVASSRLFKIEEISLKFSNGAKRRYERLCGLGVGAVLIVPVFENHDILLVREYAVGVEDYVLGFPKGLIDHGETNFIAADRELKEEVGYGAKRFTELGYLTLAPGYVSGQIQVLLAEDLYPEKLVGDEPEEMEVVRWPLEDIAGLLAREDFHEARSTAALLLAQQAISARI